MYGYGNENETDSDKRKVALYARVSTEHEAQLSALSNQIDWYKPILEQHPEWELVREYIDEGITGTAAYKRPQFMQMIADAEQHKFDLIITREVSRFARNTVDTLQYTRSLKAKGVEVFFINDNIRTFDGDGELRLTIMATLAQDESRKTSIRVKSGQQTSMNNGVVYGNGNILGYDRVGKEMVINPEQAKTVRMIYDWYLCGWGLEKIKYELEKQGRLTAMGKKNWYCTVISHILRNPFYYGLMVYHKQYTPDFLEQKKINNFGEIEQTKVIGKHEPIVTEEEFNRVQKIMSSRRIEVGGSNLNRAGKHVVGKRPKADVWSKLLICSCGCTFNRSVWHRYGDKVSYGYLCYKVARLGSPRTRMNKGLSVEGACDTPMIAGWKLQMMAKYIFRKYLNNTKNVLSIAMSILEEHIEDKEVVDDNAAIIEQKRAELDKMQKRYNNLIGMRADNEITQAVFLEQQKMVDERITTLQSEIEELAPNYFTETAEANEEDYQAKILLLRCKLEQYVDFTSDDDIPDEVVEAFVEKIVASKNGFDWYLRFTPPDDNPKKLKVLGDKRKASIQELGSKGDVILPESPINSEVEKIVPRLLNCSTGSNQRMKDKYKLIGGFVLDKEYAKSYVYAYSAARRILRWQDLTVRLYI